MKNFIEVTSVDGDRALINTREISIVKATSGEAEPEFRHIQVGSELRYTFIRINGEPDRLACSDDYDTVFKKISEAQENEL